MNRLFQFLRKLLIAALAGVFISVGTFPGKVTALTLAQAPSTSDGVSHSKEEINLLELATGRATQTPTNTCPDGSGKPFKNPAFVSSKYGELEITLKAKQQRIEAHSGEIKPVNNAQAQKAQAQNYTFDGLLYQLIDATNRTDGKPTDYGLSYTPPTLKVSPGDTINLLLQNDLNKNPQDTNLHYHGFNVSPLLGSDDVVMHVHPNDPNDPQSTIGNYQMHVDIPSTHQSGLFWYHPHVHTTSQKQVLGGMSGGIIVEGIQKYYPIIKAIPLKNSSDSSEDIPPLTEQVMLFKDFKLTSNSPEKKPFNCFTLNGLIKPTITIQPGEVQFWRIGNIGADTYLNLALVNDSNLEPVPACYHTTEDRRCLYILARDGNIVTKPIPEGKIILPPASRVELLVIGNQDQPQPTTYKLVSLPLDGSKCILSNDPTSVANCYELATVAVSGDPVTYNTGKKSLPDYITSQTPTELDPSRPSPDELAQLYIPNNHKRTFTFSAKDQGKTFLINNKEYDENRIDTTVQVGDIEEWTLLNESKAPGHHAFHIHQLDFLDMTNYDPAKPQGYQDTIDLPPCISWDEGTKTCKKPSKTVVRIPFVNPVITGVFVYHCHILGHEDKGMMQNIKVINPPLAAPVRDVWE